MRLALAFVLTAALPAVAAAEDALPFVGRWNCEVGTFTFTATSYDPGEAPMEILDIAQEGDGYILTFEDDYQLSLAMNPDGTMAWFSPASGDSFTCARLD